MAPYGNGRFLAFCLARLAAIVPRYLISCRLLDKNVDSKFSNSTELIVHQSWKNL